jgi:hypothetical protein
MDIDTIKCPDCGSRDLQYERDSALIATVVGIRREGTREILILDQQPQPEWLDNVQVFCRACGREQLPIRWDDEYPADLPEDAQPVDADTALDGIAATARMEGDVVAAVQELVPRTGRLIGTCRS